MPNGLAPAEDAVPDATNQLLPRAVPEGPLGATPRPQRRSLTQGTLEANYAMRTGAFGQPGDQGAGRRLVNIKTPNGATWQVNEAAAPQFQGFLNDLAAQGHDLRSAGGYNARRIRGGSNWSEHAWGTAIDVNPDDNPMGPGLQTSWGPEIGDLAAKWGLKWGGSFTGRKDPMHFEVAAPISALGPDVQQQLAGFGPYQLTAPPPPGQSVIDRRSQDLALLNKTIYERETASGRNVHTSTAGARGPMQIMPQTFASYARPGESIDNYVDNMRVGHRIIADLYDRNGGNLDATLIGYNSDENLHVGQPFHQLPAETQNYLRLAHRDWGDMRPIETAYQPYTGPRQPRGGPVQVAQAGSPIFTDAPPLSHNEPSDPAAGYLPSYAAAPGDWRTGFAVTGPTQPLFGPSQRPLLSPDLASGIVPNLPPLASQQIPNLTFGPQYAQADGAPVGGTTLAAGGAAFQQPSGPIYTSYPALGAPYANAPGTLYTGGAAPATGAAVQTAMAGPGGPGYLPPVTLDQPGGPVQAPTRGVPGAVPGEGGPADDGWRPPGMPELPRGAMALALAGAMLRGTARAIPVDYDPFRAAHPLDPSFPGSIVGRNIADPRGLAEPVPVRPVTAGAFPASPFAQLMAGGARGGRAF